MVSDITYTPLSARNFCYLSMILDRFSRRLIGWHSRAADCYDNAFMESCFGTIKTELEMTEYSNNCLAHHLKHFRSHL